MRRERTRVCITARAVLDRRAAEAFRLETRRLARQLGLTLAAVRVRKIGAPTTSAP